MSKAKEKNNKTIGQAFAKALGRELADREITPFAIAKSGGVSNQYLSDILAGKNTQGPTLGKYLAICRGMGVNPAVFLKKILTYL